MIFPNPYPDLQDLIREADIMNLQVQPPDLNKPGDLKRYLMDLNELQQKRLERDEHEQRTDR